jgi:predicted ArsR family transcriptional regulator
MRPDGRAPTPETRKLRVTTRALRYHLDTLPIEYDLDVSSDRFLAVVVSSSQQPRSQGRPEGWLTSWVAR